MQRQHAAARRVRHRARRRRRPRRRPRPVAHAALDARRDARRQRDRPLGAHAARRSPVPVRRDRLGDRHDRAHDHGRRELRQLARPLRPARPARAPDVHLRRQHRVPEVAPRRADRRRPERHPRRRPAHPARLRRRPGTRPLATLVATPLWRVKLGEPMRSPCATARSCPAPDPPAGLPSPRTLKPRPLRRASSPATGPADRPAPCAFSRQCSLQSVERLWAPWRLSYIKAPRPEGCVFCDQAVAERRGRADRAPRRALLRRAQPLPLRQRAPDDPAVPARRLARRSRRRPSAPELWDLLDRALAATREGARRRRATTSASTSARRPAPASRTTCTCTSCRAGRATCNFMPVLADVRVMPQHLSETRAAHRRGAWPH